MTEVAVADANDWIKCIRKPHESEKHLTWCGRHAFGWVLIGLDHAACLAGNYTQPCPACVAAACGELQSIVDPMLILLTPKGNK